MKTALTATVAYDQQIRVTVLPDGFHVWSNTNTEIIALFRLGTTTRARIMTRDVGLNFFYETERTHR